MKKFIVLIILFSTFSFVSFAGNDKETSGAQATTTIQGKITDMKTMEELTGVTVQIEGTEVKAYSDIEGNFKIEGVEPGTYNLSISYISYKQTKLENIQATVTGTSDVKVKLEQVN